MTHESESDILGGSAVSPRDKSRQDMFAGAQKFFGAAAAVRDFRFIFFVFCPH
ncbi:MAG TPA: hypothetical protein VHS96_05025 [Bacteroidia bacterium]|nr:hypothetical protein [Bacteroidia bacterium]